MKRTPNPFLFLLLLVFWIIPIASKAQHDSLKYPFLKLSVNHILTRDTTTLQPFLRNLRHFNTNRDRKIKILHIGDSHVQAGFWSNSTRSFLKKYFNDSASMEPGFMFPYKLAGSNGNDRFEFTNKIGVWEKCRNVYVEKDCGWGMSGYIIKTESSQSGFTLKTRDSAKFNRLIIYHYGYDGEMIVSSPGAQLIHSRYSDTLNASVFLFNKEVNGFDFQLSLVNSAFIIRGIEMQNALNTISFNELGVNGAEVKSFVHSPLLPQELSGYNPDLVILALGTNDAYSTSFKDSIFAMRYDSLLAIVTRACPNTNIILCTPGDCKRFKKYVNKNNLTARDLIVNLAEKYNCGVFDWFNVMGGLGCIDLWYGEKLCSADKIHLMESGYDLQGKLLGEAIVESYERFKNQKDVVIEKQESIDWSFLWKWIFYDNNNPLLFSSILFLMLFVVLMAFYSVIYKHIKARNIYLLLFSLFFYYKAGGYYFSLLLLSTVIDYYIGQQIFRTKKQTERKLWLWVSLTANLALLGFFKYSYFAIDTINHFTGTDLQAVNWFSLYANILTGSSFDIYEIILPVGISFYTFQTMSYSIDIYRKRIAPLQSISDFAFYVSFFPQLVAGPIVRAAEFVPQLRRKYELTQENFTRAIMLIGLGLIKKMVVSDYISVNFVDRVFDAPLSYTSIENLLAAYGYSIQIFCDFSGYSDMAIGIALLLGFQLPSNFNSPFSATNITEFWRRWHISLSTWLKDYLYISLGGNRKGKFRTYVHLLLTMLLGGLWHGASMRFIWWGGAHGMALVMHKLWMKINPLKPESLISRFTGWLITFHFVVICFVLFRVSSMQKFQEMMGMLLSHHTLQNTFDVVVGYRKVLMVMVFGFALQYIPDHIKTPDINWSGLRWMGASLGLFALIFVVYQFKTAGVQPFIYFQF